MSENITNDLDERVKGFNKELTPLLKKYKLGIGGNPFITKDGRIVGRPTVFDDVSSYEKKEVKDDDTGGNETNDSGLKSA